MVKEVNKVWLQHGDGYPNVKGLAESDDGATPVRQDPAILAGQSRRM
jgi:hypothetical protein